ncbi:acyltransferase family protein [Micromonospora sp. NPDC005806]|uniref:acyltransferase family protein n=1 Tax=Micromonospora sp. NPDC005806 TaxID=3364234 RepID=UPI003691A05B
MPPAAPTVALPSQPLAAAGHHGQGPAENRLYILDLLRFLAALSVVGYHVFVDNGRLWGIGVWAHWPLLGQIFTYGWIGVEFFFVISGFVICMSSWGRSVSEFAISRVARLMPAYVFAVLFTGAMLTLFPLAEGRPEPSHVIIDLTMLQQFLGVPSIDNVYWTLFVELKFYLIFTAVIAFGVTYRRVVMFCAAWLVASLFALNTHSPLLTAVFEPRYSAYFVIGITLYLMYRFGQNLVLWAMLGVSGAMALSSLIGRVADQNQGRQIDKIEIAVAALSVFLLIMLGVALGWFDWVRWRGFVVMGALTYPVYLLHMRFSRVMLSRLGDDIPFWPMFALILGTVLLLAYLVHRFVERPLSRVLRQRLRDGLAEIRAAEPTAVPARAVPQQPR